MKNIHQGYYIKVRKRILKILVLYWLFVIIFTFFNYLSDIDFNHEYVTTEGPQFEAVVSGFELIIWTPFIVLLLSFLGSFINKYTNISIFFKHCNIFILLISLIVFLPISSIYLTNKINKSCCPLWQYKIIIVGYNVSLFIFIMLLYFSDKKNKS